MAARNILIVMADQLNPFAVGCYGGGAKTPQIDRLAAEGVRFDAAYCNSPLCTPGRYAFMTGKLKVSGNLAKLMMHQSAIAQWGAAVSSLDVEY